MFDPGGFIGRLRACSFLGAQRALLCGEAFDSDVGWYPWLERFFAEI